MIEECTSSDLRSNGSEVVRIEDERPDVLQNIEFMVIRFRRDNPSLTDSHVKRAYIGLLQCYRAELSGKDPRKPGMPRMASKLFDSLREVCEWRLGRTVDPREAEVFDDAANIDLNTLVRCLKRLVQSVKTWRGKTGYLDYVSQFIK